MSVVLGYTRHSKLMQCDTCLGYARPSKHMRCSPGLGYARTGDARNPACGDTAASCGEEGGGAGVMTEAPTQPLPAE